MKCLFIGLGSIGQRHLRNLKLILPEVEVLAYRNSRNNNVPFLNDQNQPLRNIDLINFYDIKEYFSLQKALENKPDMVFITNPSIYHGQFAIEAIKSGAFVFIEKPLSVDIESAEEILSLEKKLNQKKCMVGFQFRYSPVLIKLKELLDENIIGNLVNGQIANGEYLPNWHPYEDYKYGYAAKKELGGGALLTQIHDLDYSIYLFGMPAFLFTIGGKISSLEINVEDSVNISTNFKYKNSNLPISINLDYISWPSRRTINLYGENGSIFCDLNLNKIVVKKRSSNEIQKYDFSEITRNDIFIRELKNFIAFVNGTGNPKVDIAEGIKSLKFAMAAKQSLLHKKPIFL